MNRDTFLARSKAVKTQDVPLADGVSIKIRKLSQAEFEAINRDYVSKGRSEVADRFVVVKCALNDDGSPMFEMQDIDQLADVDAGDVRTVSHAIMVFSGIRENAKNG